MIPHTTIEPEKLLESLEEIRCNGCCLSIKEDELGLTCTGAPIIDTSQKPIVAISTSSLTVHAMEHFSECPKKVIDAAKLALESIS